MLKAILSLGLSGILILSTIGFSVSRHYCMGSLVTESFFNVETDCPADEHLHCSGDGEHNSHEKLHLNSCCEDQLLLINGLEVLSLSKQPIQVSAHFVAAFIYTSLPFQKEALSLYSQKTYLPPPEATLLSGTEILIRVQRFLI